METLLQTERKKGVIWKYIFVVIFMVIGLLLIVSGHVDNIRYKMREQLEVEVSAVISKVDTKYKENGVRYVHVYAEFTYEGKEYTILYKSKKLSANSFYLVFEGDPVQVKIDPRDPSRTMDTLESSAYIKFLWGFVLFPAGVALTRKRENKSHILKYGWNRHSVQAELGDIVRKNAAGWLFFFALAATILISFCIQHYLAMLIIGIIALVLGLLLWRRWKKDCDFVRENDFHFRTAIVTDKRYRSRIDRDGMYWERYVLTYSTTDSDMTWTRCTSKRIYDTTNVGDDCEVVFLGDHKGPILYKD